MKKWTENNHNWQNMHCSYTAYRYGQNTILDYHWFISYAQGCKTGFYAGKCLQGEN